MKKRGSSDIVTTPPKKKNLFEIITAMLKKRGLSTIIATLLIVLFSLILIGVLWVVISNMISKNAETTRIQNEFFGQEVNFAKVQLDPNDGLKLNASIRTSRGTLKGNTQTIIVPPSQIDVISVSDLSGSMRTCLSVISTSCCQNVMGGYYGIGPEQQNCYGFPDSSINKCTQAPPTGCNGTTLIDALTSSKNANKQLINTILEKPTDNNRVGLSAYNSSVINSFSSNLINNNQTLVNIINSWGAYGGTCICCGINDAKSKLSGSLSSIPKTIILMSDGVPNQGCSQQGTGNATNDSIKAAKDAYNQVPNLTIYSVGLGTLVDPVIMAAIAQEGHGEYFPASQVGDLASIYQSLADQIIKRFNTLHKLNYLKIVFYDSQGDSSIINVDIPDPLQTLDNEFDLNGAGLSTKVVKMEIYPVASNTQGKEVTGPIFDSWERK